MGYLKIMHGMQVLKATAKIEMCQDLTILPSRQLLLDGRWTKKPFGLSRVQPNYQSVSGHSEVLVE